MSVARELFDENSVKDLVLWNTMNTGHARIDKMKLARELFDHAFDEDIMSWYAMIYGYVSIGSHEEATPASLALYCED